ncbi:PDR/VanB family oxidoreductase [Leifsonia sp. H3M29-4]|uniref:PDR/VanB family oxidoreductase n=1 Tax=Salinibacterium metalliresistens TaxID=3031321 RepID=UPI0023D9F0F6|nr:PDR/VanB family oxidoreductase [Salinibacterium metalliresistens]MDF1479291.1 PDR/VanB family oxidoreductase [Salinibacterium metalliresistens]
MNALDDTAYDMVVHRRDDSTEGVAVLELVPATDRPLPRWQPGAHIDVLLPNGDARQYSLCGEPGAQAYRIGVLREPDGRGGSAWIHDTLHPGASVRVAGPRNHFEFVPERGTRYRFLAAGIGITPIVAMLRSAAESGVDYALEYSGRSRAHMALLDEVLAEHGSRVSVHAADEGRRLDIPALFADLPPFTTTYCCGPARFIEAVEQAARGRQLKVERFEAKELGEPVLKVPFEVELAFSGETITVPPEKTVLQAIEDAGVLVLSSCKVGTCGTCETRVMAGEVDHRDSILTADEQAANDVMYVCVSRSAGPSLTLEL